MTYDEWKTTDPADRYSDAEAEPDCTCPLTLTGRGTRRTSKWCPIHGLDPDAEYDRQRDDLL